MIAFKQASNLAFGVDNIFLSVLKRFAQKHLKNSVKPGNTHNQQHKEIWVFFWV